jgi:hypothetical protein
MAGCVKQGLLIFIFIILLLPLVQQNLHVINNGKLYGYFEPARDIHFSWQKWFDGTFQQGKSNYHNDSVGFRPALVRLNNQIEFSLFNKMTGWITLGLNDCLFDESYIKAYTGADFTGEKVILERLLKLKAISDTLANSGKSFVLVYAPNKAFFYPENIPEHYISQKKEKTNLQVYKHIGDSLGINQIDFNAWIISMKKTSKELLFSKQGIHWTNYAAFIAGDSLVRYIEKMRRIKMLHPVCSQIIHTDNPVSPDADTREMTNLIFPAVKETFSYPVFKYIEDTTTKKPRVIFIGDIFVFNMLNNQMPQSATTDWQLWFYFGYVINSSNNEITQRNLLIKNYDWKNEINKADCIVMLYSSTNLSHLGDSFIEQAYDYYYPKK